MTPSLLFFLFILILAAHTPSYAQSSPPPIPTPLPAPISISSEGQPGNGWSSSPSISADGRFVAFVSDSTNLVTGDTNGVGDTVGVADVFVHDRQTGETTRVSVSTDGKQANAASARPAISGNGRFVAFESLASNLVPGDTNDAADIFVHDRLTGETKRVSVGIDGEQANGPSERVTIAHDGRYLAYQSLASNLTRGDDNDTWDIYIYDNGVTGNVIRESVSTEGEGGNGQSYTPAISGDGRIVAFVSEADNLVSGDSNGQPDVFVYHRVLAKTELVSVSSTGVQAESWTASPSLSFSGRNVVFTSPATNLAPGTQGGHNIFLRDRQESITRLLVASSPEIPYLHLAFSDDAKILFYQTPLVEGAGELIWQNIRTGAAQTIWGAVIDPRFDLSGDGQTAVFASSDDPETAFSQVYVWETRPQSPAHFISGQITDPLGTPLALVTLTDPFGNSTRTGIDGRFWLNGYAPGPVTLTAKKEGYSIRYSAFSVQLTEDMTGVDFTATPTDALTEARLDLGMPYNFDRGCDNPFKGCDGPFHGFTAGYCTDLVLDAYTYGLDFNIQFDLEQDANAHPAHFYRWRNARNTHDMWRFFSYTGQMRPHDAPYQPGDIVFFDWTEDGELDHVALVSGVDENGRPTTMLDATGVTGYNPSGLAAELPWEPFHERTVRGHARWSGAYQPVVRGFPEGVQVLQIALSGGNVNLRVVDESGDAISLTENGIPGGRYENLVWEEIASVENPLAAGGGFTVEITARGEAAAPYQFTVQLVEGGRVIARVEAGGNINPGSLRRIPVRVGVDANKNLTLEAIPSRVPKIRGIFIRP